MPWKNGQYKIGYYLGASEDTNCTLADTPYKIGGTWTQCSEPKGFVADFAGKLTFRGASGSKFLFNGVSDLAVSKASRITYMLYKNGVLVSASQTPTDFAAASKYSNISITQFMRLDKYDYLEVYCKSDVAANVVTSNSLQLTFLQVK